MNFGEKLHKLRTEQNMTQETLAQELGVSRQAISRWELGEVVPDTANVLAVSRLFGVSTDYLLREDCGSDRDIPAVKIAETYLRRRQQEVGGGILVRFGMLAVPALYHTNVRSGREPEMLPFLIGMALLFGILLAWFNERVTRRTKKASRRMLLLDLAAVLSVCFLPSLLDWIPGGYGLLVSQLIAVVPLLLVWRQLQHIYDLPSK